MKTTIMMCILLVLGGCASQEKLYDWGDYESGLYESYKDPNKMAELRTHTEIQIAQVEQSGHKVAPGLYAELGTLYLQSGDSDKAISMYKRERAAWPESNGLMSAMITNLERRLRAQPEIKK